MLLHFYEISDCPLINFIIVVHSLIYAEGALDLFDLIIWEISECDVNKSK